MNINKFLQRLKELFPEILDDYSIIGSINSDSIDLEFNKIIITIYFNEQIENISELNGFKDKDYTISNIFVKSDSINGYLVNPNEFFDIENSTLNFDDFYKAKKFITNHKEFPTRMFYDDYHNGKILFKNVGGKLQEIPNIVEYEMGRTVFFYKQ